MRTVDLGVLVSACVSLARSAAREIRSVSASGALNTVDKGGGDDPMTEADLRSQRLIIAGLWKLCPGIAVVGEENTPEVQTRRKRKSWP